MTDLIQGITHTVQGVVESLIAIVKAGFHVAYTFVHGLLTMLWNTIESFATFLGASVNFVFSNIILLVVLVVFFVFYRSSNGARATVSKGKKKAE